MKRTRNKIALVVTAALAAAVGSAPVALADDHDHSPSTLTVEKRVSNVNTPNAGTVTGAGISCGSDCGETYPFREGCFYIGEGGNHNAGRTQCEEELPDVTLSATKLAGYEFAGWSGGGCSGTGSCQPSFAANDVTVVANYTEIPDTAPPTGSITGPTEGQLVKGDIVLTADASDSKSGVKEVQFFLNDATAAYATDTTAPYQAELNTKQLNGGDGDHSVYVVVVDKAGNTYESPKRGYVVDNTKPVLDVDGLEQDQVITQTQPTLTFSATDAHAVNYSCAVDGAPFASCASPFTLPELADGQHEILVSATDAAANTSIQLIRFTVDTTGPNVDILSGPKAKNKIKKGKYAATFTFAPETDEIGITYECRMDQGAWAPCTSPTTIKVKPGSHQFQVKAKDANGVESVTVAGYGFEVVKKKRKK